MLDHRLIALTCALLVGCAQPPAESTPTVDLAAETAALQARSEALVALESAQDAEGAMAFWAPDAVVHPSEQPQIEGREGIRALYDMMFDSGTLVSFEGTTTRVDVAASGDLGWEYGVNRMVLSGPDGDMVDQGKYLAIWKKLGGEWVIAALSFTSDTPEPVPAGG